MNNSNVVIPREGRDLREGSSAHEREYPLTYKVSSGRSLVTLAIAIALLLTTAVFSFAQSITPDVVSSGGGDTTNANVSLSWTVGEPVVETAVGGNAQITQGFHQSHFEVVSIEEHPDLGYDILVYPNPSTDFIHVELSFNGKLPAPNNMEFNIVLKGNDGKLILTQNIKNTLKYKVPMQDYAVGQYILQISGADGQLYKSAQIIKLK